MTCNFWWYASPSCMEVTMWRKVTGRIL